MAAIGLVAPSAAAAHVRFHGPLAHVADYVPDDPGRGAVPGGWARVQWNFTGPFGVNAPAAWQNLIDAGAPGGRGVIVAVLDTGVAYADHGRRLRSPDLKPSSFVRGYDFVDHDPIPEDREGHGTHVASTIVEATDNGYGLTGLAYGARVMPVRVLDSHGEGDAATIARGVRFAVDHGAQIINMSLEFTDVVASDIPSLISAMRYAYHRGVLVVAAAGNESDGRVDYPARSPYAIAVGATTEHGCLSQFSNTGPGLDVVAPGGGADAIDADPTCDADGPPGHDIYQVTYTSQITRHFGIPGGYEGTSMATPHVSATAALVIASGVLGARPTPTALRERLEGTARDLGPPGYDHRFGWGLIDAAAATAPGGPLRPKRR
ncbi:MAG TPA: S8 family serine peptidase [Solirubrobacteraceae bacterium]|nr:S8 family serine peptidase [Solirubrobacteraceae bacterium]